MKKVIWIITMLAAGLGGYWLGQRPDSPRIFEWLSRQAEQIEAEGGSQWISDTMADGRDGAASMFEQIRNDDDAAPVAEQSAQASPAQRSTIPECW